jgi:hypothetical protein
VVVFVAAVFVLQAAVAQSAQLAVPLAWQLARERDVRPQVVPHAEQDDQLAAQSVPCELLAVRSVASPADPRAAHSAALQVDLQVVHSAPYESLAVHSVASLGDPQADCLALDELPAVHSVPCELLAVRSVASPGDPPADYLAVRLADDHWSQAAVS